jgi:hypothetical protein
MTDKELEKLEKSSLYTMRADPTIKDQVVTNQLNELNRIVKKEVKRNKLMLMVIEIN